MAKQKANTKPADPTPAPAPTPAQAPAPTPAPAQPTPSGSIIPPHLRPSLTPPAQPQPPAEPQEPLDPNNEIVHGMQHMEEEINELMAMGFERSQIKAALQAAFFNKERAVEYLLTVG